MFISTGFDTGGPGSTVANGATLGNASTWGCFIFIFSLNSTAQNKSSYG
ncbi:hypothetical protein QE422_000363 [Chryseobacterium sp. SORGH_AS 447]|nr:hypothetical protein [Chryseobacterium sp. SORGH_AS_0447]